MLPSFYLLFPFILHCKHLPFARSDILADHLCSSRCNYSLLLSLPHNVTAKSKCILQTDKWRLAKPCQDVDTRWSLAHGPKGKGLDTPAAQQPGPGSCTHFRKTTYSSPAEHEQQKPNHWVFGSEEPRFISGLISSYLAGAELGSYTQQCIIT